MRNKLLIVSLIGLFIVGGVFWLRVSRPQQTILTHTSTYSQSEFYDDAYAAARPVQPVSGTYGVLVNHHLLAAPLIAEALSAVATTKPVTVVLISPNHFSVGEARVIASGATWETPYGAVQPDLASIRALTDHNLAQVEEAPFDHEHGIAGVVAFIKKSLPNARIVPLILNDRLPVTQAQEAAKRMASLLPNDALIVGSFDFSHYVPSRAAQFHDELSLSVVQRSDYADIPRLDIDSRPGLALFLQLLAEKKSARFTLLEHANSAELTRTPDTLETTSYITGYFIPAEHDGGLAPGDGVNTALFLGRLETSPEVQSGLEPRSKKYAIEYLQRFLTGQQLTITGASESNPSGIFSRVGFTHFAGEESTYDVGGAKVSYVAGDSLVRARELINLGSRIVCMPSGEPKIEEYRGGLIIQGLGDFLTREVLEKTKHTTLAIGVAVEVNKLRVYIFPIQYQQGKGKLLVGSADDTLLTTLAAQSAVSGVLKEQIKKGILTISIK